MGNRRLLNARPEQRSIEGGIEHILRAFSAIGLEFCRKFGLLERQHGDGQQRGIGGAGRADGQSAHGCLLYTSDAADDLPCVDLGGRRALKNKTTRPHIHPAHYLPHILILN